MNKLLASFLLLLLAGCTTTGPTKPDTQPGPVPTVSPSPSPVPTPTLAAARLTGITLDSLDVVDKAVALLAQLPKDQVAVRVVFDEGVGAKEYVSAVAKLRKVAIVVGELLDSDSVADCSQSCYEKRARDYAATFAGKIDIIEACNEISGSGWLGSGTHDKCSAAIRILKAAGIPTMLTLYSEEGDSWKTWIQKLPSDIPALVDWVTLSEYPGDNLVKGKPYVTDMSEFKRIIGAKFPRAKIGYGEVGPAEKNYKKTSLPDRMKYITDCKLGPCLYWFGSQEIRTNPDQLLNALKQALK